MKSPNLIILSLMLYCQWALAQNAVEIKFKVPELANQTSLLVNYFGDKQYIMDTLYFDAKGTCKYTRKDPLHRGIYLVYMPNQQIFEFIGLGSEKLEITSSLDQPVEALEIKGSKENELFVPYQKRLQEVGMRMMPIRDELDEAQQAGDNIAVTKLQKDLQTLNDELNDYRLQIAQANQKTFLAKVINAMQDVQIPKDIDSTQRYQYYKDHYFDNVDLSESGLLYTPIYHNKVMYYVDNMLHPHYDSIIHDVSDLLNTLYESNNEVYRYTLSKLLSKYESSKIITHENIFYHLGEEFYFNRPAPDGASADFLEKLRERLDKIKTCRIGQRASDFIGKDSTGNFRSLSQMNYDFTILIIYDPSCGTCKKTMKSLAEFFETAKDTYSIGVFSTATHERKPDGEIQIPQDPRWVDVFDSNGYRSLYDSYSVPLIYILDKNKDIILKRVSVEQAEDLIKKETALKNSKP